MAAAWSDIAGMERGGASSYVEAAIYSAQAIKEEMPVHL